MTDDAAAKITIPAPPSYPAVWVSLSAGHGEWYVPPAKGTLGHIYGKDIPGMRFALKLPSTQVIVHYLAVFLAAFGTTMVTSTTGAFNVGSLEALLIAGLAAVVTAVAHVALGLVPTPVAAPLNALGVSLKVKTAAYQVLVSVLATFLTIFGAALIAGATHLTSLPGVIDVVLAAISAGVAGIVTYVTGLIPAPKPAVV